MKILLTHVYASANKGDAGIVGGMLDELTHRSPQAHITLLSMEDPSVNPFPSPRVTFMTSFFYEIIYRSPATASRVVRTLILVPLTLVWSLCKRMGIDVSWLLPARLKPICHAYAECDLVIPVGGCYLRTDTTVRGYITLILQLHSLWIPLILRKKVYLYPQSIGPFARPLHERLVAWTLTRVTATYVREDISYKLLHRIGIPEHKIRTGHDAGFLVTPPTSSKKTQRVVGVTVREWLPYKAQARYELAIAKLADYLIEAYSFQVVIIPQVTSPLHNDDDRIVSSRVYELIHNRDKVRLLTDDYTYKEIVAIYSSLAYFVGTRMHSVIFSLVSYVPSIAIEYEHKTRGVMRDLGLEQWVIRMEDVTYPRMKKLCDTIIKHSAQYKKHLARVMPSYIAEAKRPIADIVEETHS